MRILTMNRFAQVLMIILMAIFLPALSSLAQDDQIQPGVFELAWSPDGTKLAVANPDGKIYILNPSGDILAQYSGHSRQAWTVAWSPDGRFLASGGYLDRLVNIWDVSNGQLFRQLFPANFEGGAALDPGVANVRWSPDGNTLIATSFDTFQFWETASWLAFNTSRSGSLYDAEWSRDGTLLGITDPYTLSFANGETLLRENLEADVIQIAGENPEKLSWSSDSHLLATTDRLDPRISIWNVPMRTRVGEFIIPEGLFKDVSFISDNRVAAITENGMLYILDSLGNLLSVYDTGIEGVRTFSWNDALGLFAIGGSASVIGEGAILGLPIISIDDILPTPTPIPTETPTATQTPTPLPTATATPPPFTVGTLRIVTQNAAARCLGDWSGFVP